MISKILDLLKEARWSWFRWLSKNDHHHRKVTPDLKKYRVVLRKWFFILKSAWPKVTKRETLIKSHQTSLSLTTPCYSDSRSILWLLSHFHKNHPKPHLLLDIISILTQDNILSISTIFCSFIHLTQTSTLINIPSQPITWLPISVP